MKLTIPQYRLLVRVFSWPGKCQGPMRTAETLIKLKLVVRAKGGLWITTLGKDRL